MLCWDVIKDFKQKLDLGVKMRVITAIIQNKTDFRSLNKIFLPFLQLNGFESLLFCMDLSEMQA